jgi:hypothetical protein
VVLRQTRKEVASQKGGRRVSVFGDLPTPGPPAMFTRAGLFQGWTSRHGRDKAAQRYKPRPAAGLLKGGEGCHLLQSAKMVTYPVQQIPAFSGVVGCRRWRWFIRWWWCLRSWLRWRCCGWPRLRRFRRCVGFHLFMKGYSSNGTKRVAPILNTRARGCRDGTEPPKPGFEKCNPRF